ncbi:MAG: DUF523 and DUF1722 domain-containing protein, partial [Deltaproteobacteria bacterium]|nr:DUF523 and DUF1722 domain-containing protein [Deltaproteobacteria bacterium]
MGTPIKLGISSCLLGERVRWNGDHKLDRVLTDTLGKFVEYVPVCPEVECGFNIPREPFRLVGDPSSPRLITSHTKHDYTDRMIHWARKRVAELEKEGLFGFIFKSNSPSSGMGRVKVYNEAGIPAKKGVSIFARVFMEHFPLVPVEEEGRLHDPKLRENFIERIFTLKRWREALGGKENRGNLVKFHTKHKMLILSHSPWHHRMMGKLVAQVKGIPLKGLYKEYQKLLMEALRLKSTAKKNTNVLAHISGYFKKQLSWDEKQ